MKVSKIEKEALKELEEDKVNLAKSVIKQRITEIRKTRALLNRLEAQYAEMLKKDVDEVSEEVENGRIRF